MLTALQDLVFEKSVNVTRRMPELPREREAGTDNLTPGTGFSPSSSLALTRQPKATNTHREPERSENLSQSQGSHSIVDKES